MLKRAGLSLAVALIGLTAACTTRESMTTTTPTTTAPTTAAAVHPVTTKTQRTSDPGDGDLLAGLGKGADWAKHLEPCQSPQKVLIQKVVTADVNGDGTADALVAHACSPITSYWPTVVDVFDGASSSTSPKRLGAVLTDVGPTDLPYLDTLKVKNKVIQVQAYGVDKHTTQACPSIYYTYTYQFTGGRFVRLSRDAGNANHCPRIDN